MSFIAIFSPSGTFLPFLVSTLIQVTVLAGATLCASVLLRRRSAVARHAVLLAGLTAVLLIPPAVWCMRITETQTVDLRRAAAELGLHDFRLSDTWVLTEGRAASAKPVPPPQTKLAADAALTPDRGPDAERTSPSIVTWIDNTDSPGVSIGTAVSLCVALLAAIWLIGLLVRGISLLRGLAAARRLLGESRRNDDETLASVYSEALGLFSRRVHPRLLQSAAVPTPMVVGTFRPAIVLPQAIEQELGRAQLRDVLVHELAHVRRRDTWVGLLQRVAGIVWWPHPLVHRLNRRLAQAREEICDNFVLTYGGKHEYARTLLQLSTRVTVAEPLQTTLGLLPAHWKLEDRVAGLLNEGRSLLLRFGPARSLALSGVVGGGMLLFAGAAVMPAPTEEEAIRQIKLLGGSVSGQAGAPDGHPQVMIGDEWRGSPAALKQLKLIRGIKEIWFSGTTMDEVILEDLPDLERIVFNVNFYDKALGRQVNWHSLPIKTIRLRNLPKIKSFDRRGGGNNLSQTQVTTLALAKMNNLTNLQVEGLQLEDGVLLSVAGAPKLTSIDASRPTSTRPGGRTQITDAGLKSLHLLRSLTGLNLDGARITDAGLKTIGKLPTLGGLGLAASDITDGGLEHLASLSELRGLGVNETAITDAGLKRIVREHSKLKSIFLGGSAVTAAGLEALRGLPELTGIELDSSQLTEQSCAVLSSLPIQLLAVDGTSTKPGRIAGLSNVRLLFVQGTDGLSITPGSLTGITDLYLRGAGPAAIRSFFQHFLQLKRLELLEVSPGWTVTGAADSRPIYVDDSLMQHVASLKSLKTLILSASRIDVGDAGIAAISDLKTLEAVLLPDSKITDRGVASLEKLVNLKRVTLCSHEITNKALPHFRFLKQLTFLNLNSTRVEQEAAERFQAQFLPKAEIQAYRLEISPNSIK